MFKITRAVAVTASVLVLGALVAPAASAKEVSKESSKSTSKEAHKEKSEEASKDHCGAAEVAALTRNLSPSRHELDHAKDDSEKSDKDCSGTASGAVSAATVSLPDGAAGASYTASLSATGGTAPYTWSLDASTPLPDGVTLASSGALSGTPAVAGSWTFTATVTDALGATSSQGFTINIALPPPVFTLSSSDLAGVVGAPYSASFNATGGTAPYSWALTAGSLPDGVSLGADGVLSGTPTVAGSFTFTLTAYDGPGFEGSKSFTAAIAK